MNATHLDQTLIVDPAVSFAHLAAVLEKLGWRREPEGPVTAPLLAGEPEWARWSWGGGKPLVIYTFNPVARLRVLDVATLPPAWRGALAHRLPLLGPEQLAARLSDPEPRQRLLGLWGLQELQCPDRLAAVQALRGDAEPTVAGEADRVAQGLARVAEARLEVLSQLAVLAEAAPALIRRLGDTAFVPTLCPDRDDCARLVDPALADGLAEAAAALYRSPPRADPGEDYPGLRVTACPAGLLRSPNRLSERFPRGYRNIAGWMAPEVIWLSWAWRSPGGGQVRYDGLAWLGHRWVWLPKPFRLLAPLLPAAPDRVH